MSYKVGFDIGGTFTDFFIIDERTGRIIKEKTPTTPDDFAEGCLRGFRQILADYDLVSEDISELNHGSTVATNALLEAEGQRTGVITTEGFRDVVAIGREKRRNLYDYSPSKLPPLTERRDRLAVPERMSANGEVLTPLDESAVRDAVAEFRDEDVESVAISYLHSYANDTHERRTAEILSESSDLFVSISSEVLPEINEFERTYSTVINAYIGPLVHEYVRDLADGLEAIGIDRQLQIMQANGGMITPDKMDNRCLRLINSGPAAGVLGSRTLMVEADIQNLITLDIGGTSADASIIREQEVETVLEGEISQIPLVFPQVDVRTIGAGGGSITWIDDAGVLKVGPKSAGAQPGPICYGNGGADLTVTDASLLLGYLNPEYFLGGDMILERDPVESTFEAFADALSLGRHELANGILEIATENMAQTLRLVSVEKGHDPREFWLMPYGGAGPLLADRVARKLDISNLIIPIAPGVLSAYGLLSADIEYDFSKSKSFLVDEIDQATARGLKDDLLAQAEAVADGTTSGEFKRAYSLDMRYRGQTTKITIDVEDLDRSNVQAAAEEFIQQYETLYGHSNPESAIEVVTWRVKTVSPSDATSRPDVSTPAAGSKPTPTSTRDCFDPTIGEFRSYEIYDRYELPSGATFDAPAIIEENESTTVVGGDGEIEVDELGNLLIRLD